MNYWINQPINWLVLADVPVLLASVVGTHCWCPLLVPVVGTRCRYPLLASVVGTRWSELMWDITSLQHAWRHNGPCRPTEVSSIIIVLMMNLFQELFPGALSRMPFLETVSGNPFLDVSGVGSLFREPSCRCWVGVGLLNNWVVEGCRRL